MKKLIALALVLVLMLGVLPGAAFADDGVEESAPAAESVSNEAPAAEAASDEAPAAETVSDEVPAAEDVAEAPAAEASVLTAPEAPAMPTAPAEPDLSGLSDTEANRRIEAYNQAVETYNAEVETYNAALESYREAVAAYNAEAEQFNAEAEIFNAEAEEHNKAEQEKLAAYEVKMEEYNKRLAIYNKNVDTIATISARNTAKIETQMEQLGEIGRVDKESIKALGTVLEEDYVVKYGRREVSLGKPGDLVISWDALRPTTDHNTIKVTAGEASEQTYKVANLHIFQDFKDVYEMSEYQAERGWDCMNINIDDANGVIIIPAALIDRMVMMEYEVAQVGANDSVTVSSQNSIFSATPNLMTPRFLEGYTDGNCWYNDCMFASNAGSSETDWTGTSHTFSFADGTSDRADIKNPLNVNRYFFRMALRQIPSVINYNPAPVPMADPEPDEPEEIAEPEVPQAKPVEIPAETEEAEIVPLIAFIETEEILPEEVPMAKAGSWALVNLIAAALSVLIAAAMLLGIGRRENEEDRQPAAVKVCSVIVAAAAVILFVLTEDMHLRMALTDIWTPAMIALFALNAVLAMTGSRKEEKEAA